MTRKTKLDDIQLLLLSVAATRPDGSLLPPSDTLGELSDRIRAAINALLRRKLAREIAVLTQTQSWRQEGDRLVGLVITDAGRAAIAADPAIANAPPSGPAPPKSDSERRATKQSIVINMLCRADGAALVELCEATSWQPHSCRAFLSGLRKNGCALERDKRDDGVTIYRLAPVKAAA